MDSNMNDDQLRSASQDSQRSTQGLGNQYQQSSDGSMDQSNQRSTADGGDLSSDADNMDDNRTSLTAQGLGGQNQSGSGFQSVMGSTGTGSDLDSGIDDLGSSGNSNLGSGSTNGDTGNSRNSDL